MAITYVDCVALGHTDDCRFACAVRSWRNKIISFLAYEIHVAPNRLSVLREQREKEGKKGLTSSRPPNDPELTGDVHNISSVPWPTIVRWKGFLLEHLRDLRSGREPASAVVDAIDAVEGAERGVVRELVVAQNSLSSIRFSSSFIIDKQRVLTAALTA